MQQTKCPSVDNFSISQLQRFSGIKAHTIRMWEKRYGMPMPLRNPNNKRYYSPEETKNFLDIAILNLHCGFRVSRLATMNRLDIQGHMEMLRQDEGKQVRAVHDLLIHMHRRHVELFEDQLDEIFKMWGSAGSMRDVILPFLQKAPLLSYAHTDSNTHFAVTAIRQKIMMAIEGAAPVHVAAPKALLFLPSGEHYDLMLLCLSFFLKTSRFRVLYLGTNIPLDVLNQTVLEKEPQYIYSYLPAHSTAKRCFDFDSFAAYLSVHLPNSRCCIVTEALPDSRPALPNAHYVAVESLSHIFENVT